MSNPRTSLKDGQYTEKQLEKATCPDCGKALRLEYNDMISANCCKNLYGIYPSNYQVFHDKMN